MTIDKLK